MSKFQPFPSDKCLNFLPVHLYFFLSRTGGQSIISIPVETHSAWVKLGLGREFKADGPNPLLCHIIFVVSLTMTFLFSVQNVATIVTSSHRNFFRCQPSSNNPCRPTGVYHSLLKGQLWGGGGPCWFLAKIPVPVEILAIQADYSR